MVYVFLGHDVVAKDARLASLKNELIPQHLLEFNYDALFARDLTRKGLQERLLFLPVKIKQRLVVIRDAAFLKEECRLFLAEYVKKPLNTVVVVLDYVRNQLRDPFLEELRPFVRMVSFREDPRVDAFMLGRAIGSHRPDQAVKILGQLLQAGEKPERIMGGLRYAFERDTPAGPERKRFLRTLLSCDVEIKTGKLPPELALEKLVVSLSGLGKSKAQA